MSMYNPPGNLIVNLGDDNNDGTPGEGNRIVPNPPEALGFPTLVFAAMIVAAGIWVVSEMDNRAGWLLAFLVLLGVAFRYKSFGDEIIGLLSPQSR